MNWKVLSPLLSYKAVCQTVGLFDHSSRKKRKIKWRFSFLFFVFFFKVKPSDKKVSAGESIGRLYWRMPMSLNRLSDLSSRMKWFAARLSSHLQFAIILLNHQCLHYYNSEDSFCWQRVQLGIGTKIIQAFEKWKIEERIVSTEKSRFACYFNKISVTIQ